MAALIDAARQADYPATIALVLSNRPDAAGIAHATHAGIATAIVDHRHHGRDRAAFERAMEGRLAEHDVDFICLAGFMRVLTDAFVGRWQGRLINIHPSLLPSFKGLDTHARAIAAGVRIHGCTVHYVEPEVDAGPIIMQAAVRVAESDTPARLARRVLAQEHAIYPVALRLVCEGRAPLRDGRVAIDAGAGDDDALVAPAICNGT
jgi:phosphoribosylglycinamide formyltransferase 1